MCKRSTAQFWSSEARDRHLPALRCNRRRLHTSIFFTSIPNKDSREIDPLTSAAGCHRSDWAKEDKLYELQKEGQFPRRIQITAHAVGWIENEIEDWIAERVAASRSHTG